MSDDDWYRSPTWDRAAQDAFEARLRRARSSRSQYLRIKGLALLDTGETAKIEAGRDLLRRVLIEHPDAVFDTTGALFALGSSCFLAGELDAAASHLRACLDAEHGANISHNAELRLAEVLVATGDPDHLEEASRLLVVEVQRGPVFPVVWWRLEVTRARIASLRGNPAGAREHALAALQHAGRSSAPFPRHPGVGLVPTDRAVQAEMRALAAI